MKKYLVIGNPIEHSLSPKLHNYWFEKNNINANYDRKKIDKSEIQDTINENENVDDVYAFFNKKNTKISTICNVENFDDNKLHIFLDKCQKDLIAIDKLVEKTYF